MKKPGILNFTIIFALLVLFCLLPSISDALIGIEEGDKPKDIVLTDLDGNQVNVSDYFGEQPVIIVFWELMTDKAFLNYSLDELIFLNDYYEKYHDSNKLEIFGIYTPEEDTGVSDQEITMVRNLVMTNKIKFPILIDKGFKFFQEYGVIALPSTIMIGDNGKINFIYPSFPISAREVFAEKIDEMVGIIRVAVKEEEKLRENITRANRLYNYAVQMYERGFFEQSMSPLKKSIEMDPDFTWSHNLMGIILWKKGNFNAAVDEFKRALDLNEDNSSAHFNYGLLLFENGKFDEAEGHLSTSISLKDSRAEAHYVLGKLYLKTEKTEEALKELNRALELFEEKKTSSIIFDSSIFHTMSVSYALAQLYIDSGNHKAALELLQKAVQLALGLENTRDLDKLHRSKDLMAYE